MDKKEIAEKVNLPLKTLYNWEKNRPEVMKYIMLGLEYEKMIENDEVYTKERVEKINKRVDGMEKEIDTLKDLFLDFKNNFEN